MAQAYLENEEFEHALQIFKEMKLSGFEPNEFSFVCALAACASLAWQGVGKQIHSNLIKTSLILDAFLGRVLIDMSSKSTAITDGIKAFAGTKREELITWNAMIIGLSQNGCLEEVLKLLSVMNEKNTKPDAFTLASVLAVCASATTMQQGR